MLSAVRSLATFPLRRLSSLLHRPAGDLPATPAPRTTTPVATEAPAGASAAPSRSDGRRKGKYDDALLAVVADRPGVTVAQAAEQIGLPATGLYPTVRRLQEHQQLVKRGRELHPA